MVLPLGDLWKRQPKDGKKQAIKQSWSDHPYPILFPRRNAILSSFDLDNGQTITIMTDKRMYQHLTKDMKSGGAILLGSLDFINKACKFQVGQYKGENILLVFNPMMKRIFFYHFESREIATVSSNNLYHCGRQIEFIFDDGLFYYGDKYYFNQIEYSSKPVVTRVNSPLPLPIREAYEARKQSQFGFYRRSDSVLKNVKSVFINHVNNLVLNIHELRFDEAYQGLRFEKSQFLENKVRAERKDTQTFEFVNGSRIRIDPSGMMLLESADLATIYIPLALAAPLGAATKTHFTGDDYFLFPDAKYEQVVVQVRYFYKQFIQQFIENILNHGT